MKTIIIALKVVLAAVALILIRKSARLIALLPL